MTLFNKSNIYNLFRRHNLHILFEKNEEKNQNIIIKTINESTSVSDKPGFVYAGCKKESNTDINSGKNEYLKLGRTERTVEIRLKEQNLVKVFSVSTIYNKKAEKLVHLFFKFAHKYNPNKKGIEWFYFESFTVAEIYKYTYNICELVKEIYSNDFSNSVIINDIVNNFSNSIILSEITDNNNKININTVSQEQIYPDDLSNSVIHTENNNNNKININTASSEEIKKLNGIGHILAERIIENRKSNGIFTIIDDIQRIKGIKGGIFTKIKDNICI
jgi:competence ComEA-like helix-hairpin-helix protein